MNRTIDIVPLMHSVAAVPMHMPPLPAFDPNPGLPLVRKLTQYEPQ